MTNAWKIIMNIQKKLLNIVGYGILISSFAANAVESTNVTGNTIANMKLEPAKIVSSRDGLANAARKLNAGEAVNIVWLGGSITYGGGSPGYVQTITRWFQQNYPKAKLNTFNAGVTGTGSDFGAKRFDRDVLSHNPDLVLIEFAVNDGDDDCGQNMERMVRKAWLKNPNTDIVFFYTLAQKHVPFYQRGLLPPSASAHERVAAFYNIPTIGLAQSVADRLNAGEMTWKEFSADVCHPTEKGYACFNTTFKQVLPQLLQSGKPGPHQLGQKTMTTNLVVYPPLLKAEPLIVPDFIKDGEKADMSFILPVVARHWVGAPEFSDSSGSVTWRLRWMKGVDPKNINASLGNDRKAWARNDCVWFEEALAFTGPEGNPIISGWPGAPAGSFGCSGGEFGVLVFTAPQTGRYVFRVSAGSVVVNAQLDDQFYALNLLRFRAQSESGESLAFQKAPSGQAHPIAIEKELLLDAGDEIVFVAGKTTPSYIRSAWPNFNVTVGLFNGASAK
jgi:lysophospholipase L1-like esterase